MLTLKKCVERRFRNEPFFYAQKQERKIEMATILGGWDIEDVKGINLPQKVQSAFTAVTSEIVGA